MNKKLFGILACMLMLSSIPMVAGDNIATSDTELKESEIEPEPTGLFDQTFIRGFYLGVPDFGILRTTIFALRLKYTTRNLFGDESTISGTFILQKVAFSGKFIGFIGRHYIFGMFTGSPITI